MSTTFQLDTATSRANPTPQPMRRLTVPAIKGRKFDGSTKDPLVMLTAYTARQAQLLDEHCDILLVGDSLGQVIYGLPSTCRSAATKARRSRRSRAPAASWPIQAARR